MLAQHRIQPRAVFRRLNVARVTLAHGRDRIGENDAAFDEIELAIKLHALRAEIMSRQRGESEIHAPEIALVGDVVNGQHGLKWQPLVAHKYGHESALPVVHVDDVWRGIEPPR